MHPCLLEGASLTPLPGRSAILQTDADGRFSIPRPSPSETEAERARLPDSALSALLQRRAIVAVHERGFGVATEEELASTGVLLLKAWGRIEGEVRTGGTSSQGQTIRLRSPNRSSQPHWFHIHRERQNDAAGRFDFAYQPPGRYTLERILKAQDTNLATDRREVTLEPGVVEQVVIGRSGRLVIGGVQVQPEQSIDWTRAACALYQKPAHTPTTGVQCVRSIELRDASGRIIERQYLDNSSDTELRHYAVLISPDGSFRIPDVEPGEYILSFTWDAPRTSPRRTERRGTGKAVVVSVSEGEVAAALDLGTIIVPAT